jgi:NADP-dependent 3-hydroxy acid dehydrogenase YdfG
MRNSKPLAKHTAIVTGASSGIGRAIAEKLGEAGAHVFLAGRNADAMQESKQNIEKLGGVASIEIGDIRDIAQVQALIDSAMAATGRLDIMVNNAGLEFPGSIMEGDPESWCTMLETNVLGLIVGCQAAVKAMRSCSAEGHIVNISSVSAQRNNSGVYGATKHAVNVISSSLRDELEEDTIRVTNVMPGATSTNFARHFPREFVNKSISLSGMEFEAKEGEHLPPEVLDQLQKNAKQLLGNAYDVANAVLYAVTQPIEVNVAEIVVRPPRAMKVAH